MLLAASMSLATAGRRRAGTPIEDLSWLRRAGTPPVSACPASPGEMEPVSAGTRRDRAAIDPARAAQAPRYPDAHPVGVARVLLLRLPGGDNDVDHGGGHAD